MKFYSTRNSCPELSLEEALFTGLAPDGGLYMPKSMPSFSSTEIGKMREMSLPEIALEISKKFVETDIPTDELSKIINNAINFDAPLTKLEDGLYILELFHGPTLAFKDFGARFMAGLISYFAQKNDKKITILTATSGDTGSAVAHGFLNQKNIEVIILFPKGRVSPLQEKQITCLGGNIKAIEINGSFDDCQRLVKESFKDHNLVEKLGLSSANSINIGRLIPQTFYYFYSYSRLAKNHEAITYCIPSGNFGNLTAGLFAKKMGLPIKRFLAATNANSVIPDYLKTGIYQSRASISTISNAMDIGSPSNFERIKDLYKSFEEIKEVIWGASVTDEETKAQISTTYTTDHYLIDPHTAVGLVAAKKYNSKSPVVILSTAHPGKFAETVEECIKEKIQLPLEFNKYDESKNKR